MTPQTVGILGAGQLGRMLALAGYPLGLRFRLLDPAPDAPSAPLAEVLCAPYEAAALHQFASEVDVVTYEFENVPLEAVGLLSPTVAVFPPARALEVAQDRLPEKQFFQALGVPTPPFAPVASRTELQAAIATIGLPAVLKTRRMGYDGKGQAVLRSAEDVEAAWQALGDAPLILEGFVRFERELSVLAVRGRNGETALYPLVENTHREGILRRSVAPAPDVSAALQAQAERIATRALEALDYVGVLAIELFQVGDTLVVNEMAPRVHNSGHWTIEGAETSQFENHLRAVLGWPLGSTAPVGFSAMRNIIGTLPDIAAALALPDTHVHLYGKEPRAGRKLGHITVRAASAAQLAERLAILEQIVGEA